MVQLLFQIPSLYRLNCCRGRSGIPQTRGYAGFLKLMVPALFGVSVSQINLLRIRYWRRFCPRRFLLYYSDRLDELPLGIFGIAIATVILPNLFAQSRRSPR
ncbi:MAG: lipid II flippase MurJ [Halioglobus sp.]